MHVDGSQNTDVKDRGIVLDAGSSATRAYIYQWHHKTTRWLPYISVSMSDKYEPYTKKVRHGIASLPSFNETVVEEYLQPLLEWAHDKIPDDIAPSTPIFLRATGGMRQLAPSYCATLLASIRSALGKSGFYFENAYADVLPGEEEAAFGFISVNALYDNFKPGNLPFIKGSLDMGGVSSEIAFTPANTPPTNYSFNTNINGTIYQIYVQSHDGIGFNEARYAFNVSLINATTNVVVDPCAPLGYAENMVVSSDESSRLYILLGTSNYTLCKNLVTTLVQELTSSFPNPEPTGAFITLDKYITIKDFYKLRTTANIEELEAQVAAFCSLSYEDAIRQHKDYVGTIQNYCFMGTYLATLLRNFYAFDPTARNILWQEHIKGYPVSWTLGFMVDYVNAMAPDTPPQVRSVRYFHTSSGGAILFISILVFLLGVVLLILQSKRPSGQYVPIL